jgi:hypothetical protein
MISIKRWLKEILIKGGSSMRNILEFAKEIIDDIVSENDICIDATLGNGHDTLYLARKSKHVYGFDIQEDAINSSQSLLDANSIANTSLIHDGHQNLDQYVKEPVKLGIFNLGYLPNGDKSITTTFDSTIIAIEKVLEKLVIGGVCIVVIYTGHEAGKIESEKVLEYASNLDRYHYNVLKYDFINKKNPPYVIAIEKRKQ